LALGIVTVVAYLTITAQQYEAGAQIGAANINNINPLGAKSMSHHF
jgi:hypothetical protein